MNEYKDDFESFLVKDDLDGLIRYLKIIPEIAPEKKKNVTAINGRLKNLEMQRNAGIINNEEYVQTRNKIRYSLLNIVSNFDTYMEKKIIREKKRKNIIANINRYGKWFLIIGFSGIITTILVKKIKEDSRIEIPRKYKNKIIDRESVIELNALMEKDTTIGNDEFRSHIKSLNSFSQGRDSFAASIRFFSKELNDKIVDNNIFEKRVNEFYQKIGNKNITYKKLYQEILFIKDASQGTLKKEIDKELSKIDTMCSDIQNIIDQELEFREKILKKVVVEIENFEVSKRTQRINVDFKVQNSLKLNLYSIEAYIYATSIVTGDTITRMFATLNEENGFGSLKIKTGYYWDQKHIYNALRGKKRTDLFFQYKIKEVNIDGKMHNFWADYRPSELPYGGDSFSNRNWKPTEEIRGKCPYLYLSDEKKQIDKNIKNILLDASKNEGYHHLTLYEQLNIWN